MAIDSLTTTGSEFRPATDKPSSPDHISLQVLSANKECADEKEYKRPLKMSLTRQQEFPTAMGVPTST